MLGWGCEAGTLGGAAAGGEGRLWGPVLPCMVAILLLIICACWRRCCSCCCLSLCLMLRQKGTGHLFSWQCLAW